MAAGNPNLTEESRTYIQQVGNVDIALIECLPDFMVVSPAKTGSTWLFSNLCCHPDIFIPNVKEVNYFCDKWRLYDINWYLKYFQKGIGLKKGDVSPTYAILPSYAIEVIRSLMPDLKVIFLMRDPVERAWSHARHNLKYHEANFCFNRTANKSVSDKNFIRNFTHDWPFTSGDYLNSLQQWYSFFPKEQFYIGFYENIRKEPQKLLTQVFDFLGVGVVDVDWDQFPIKTVFQEGTKKDLSDNLKRYLRTLYKNRTEELVIFLRDQFALKVPDEWKNTLIGEVIAHPISIKTNYKNHDIFLFNGKFYGLPNKFRQATTTNEIIKDHLDSGNCLVGDSLFEVKFHVNQQYGSQQAPLKNQPLIHPVGKNSTLRISNHEFNDYRLANILSTLPIGYSENYIVFQFAQLFYAIPNSLELDGDITEQTTRDHPNVVSASQLQELEKLIKETVYTEIVPRDIGGYKGFNLVQYKDQIIAMEQSLGHIDLPPVDEKLVATLKEHDQYIVADSVEDAKQIVKMICAYQRVKEEAASLKDRIESLNSQLAPFRGKPELLDSYKKFNLIRYQGRIIAVAQSVGAIDFTQIDATFENTLTEQHQYIVTDTVEKAKHLVDMLRDWQRMKDETQAFKDHVTEKEREIERLEKQLAPFRSGPDLVDSYKDFNLISYQGRIIAVARSLGPIDFTKIDATVENDLTEQHQYIVTDTVEKAKQLVDMLETYQRMESELVVRETEHAQRIATLESEYAQEIETLKHTIRRQNRESEALRMETSNVHLLIKRLYKLIRNRVATCLKKKQ